MALVTSASDCDHAEPVAGPPHHTELLGRAIEAMIGALEELEGVAGDMAGLLRRPGAATAGTDEQRYAGLRRLERRAHRRYLAAERWHDTVRRRLLEVESAGVQLKVTRPASAGRDRVPSGVR